uniref:Thiopurine S-methyltransferase n=1 Tax=Aureoumbra lagunensis TaxID=44058 RepID=A0A7S3NQ09_9STRA|mmetsp:Transcript_14010/g.18701  ORF Transcript_14010/g.18701 Transcript_14010/m.18701 type:complete len:216 (+) Transcript_14010:123-770(+)|eukprot:CAMPEP_0197302776 /NCGR_PEP_ID=MMETSP0890-20130614/51263_1 /TAXON_ID=44058 ORGANISM="Aureoumbra lagunensis, Strain CCMP1510" /NCGR_SAMPLE_ID=MMETSP0890 /ASSEMBLY_ACC=CAM_ASM_000533 /LENGTH=215 /DNA_ID=CAMNT_0042782467 /DNA_START=85 /DNA_END=732 /DNA_ORIENTATION=+
MSQEENQESGHLWEPPLQEDKIEASEALKALLPKLETGGKALVPGYRPYDTVELAYVTRKTIGLATTTEAGERAKDFEEKLKNIHTYRDLNHNAEKCKRLEFRAESFFKQQDKFDLIWDYAYFCAIEPKWHKQWAQTIERILEPTGQLAIFLWPHDKPKGGNYPPYSAEIHDINQLLQPYGFACLEKVKLDDGGTVALYRRPGACPEFPPSGPFR